MTGQFRSGMLIALASHGARTVSSGVKRAFATPLFAPGGSHSAFHQEQTIEAERRYLAVTRPSASGPLAGFPDIRSAVLPVSAYDPSRTFGG